MDISKELDRKINDLVKWCQDNNIWVVMAKEHTYKPELRFVEYNLSATVKIDARDSPK